MILVIIVLLYFMIDIRYTSTRYTVTCIIFYCTKWVGE